jgi:hypothetical protein
VQREPDEQQPGQGQLAAVGGLADGQAFGEVVQPDASCDGHAGTQRRHLDRRTGQLGLGHRHGAGADAGPLGWG